MWSPHASPPTSSMMCMHPLQRGNTPYPASVRIPKAGAKEDMALATIRTVVEEVEATDLPVARIGLTVSGKTQLVNFVRILILPVAATHCLATRGTTAVADSVVVSSVTRKLMARPHTTSNIDHRVVKLVAN